MLIQDHVLLHQCRHYVLRLNPTEFEMKVFDEHIVEHLIFDIGDF